MVLQCLCCGVLLTEWHLLFSALLEWERLAHLHKLASPLLPTPPSSWRRRLSDVAVSPTSLSSGRRILPDVAALSTTPSSDAAVFLTSLSSGRRRHRLLGDVAVLRSLRNFRRRRSFRRRRLANVAVFRRRAPFWTSRLFRRRHLLDAAIVHTSPSSLRRRRSSDVSFAFQRSRHLASSSSSACRQSLRTLSCQSMTLIGCTSTFFSLAAEGVWDTALDGASLFTGLHINFNCFFTLLT